MEISMHFDLNKMYKSWDGRRIRIYANDGHGEFPVHGAVENEDGWESSEWSSIGTSIYELKEDIVSEWDLDYNSITKNKLWERTNAPEQTEPLSQKKLLDAVKKCTDGITWNDVNIYIAEQYANRVTNPHLHERIQTAEALLYHGIINTADEYLHEIQTPEEKNCHKFENRKCVFCLLEIDLTHNEAVFRNHYCFDRAWQNIATASKGGVSEITIGYCNCGGKIDTHKSDCPEYKDPYYSKKLEPGESAPIGMPTYYAGRYRKCECGAESIGANSHSDWCAKHDKN